MDTSYTAKAIVGGVAAVSLCKTAREVLNCKGGTSRLLRLDSSEKGGEVVAAAAAVGDDRISGRMVAGAEWLLAACWSSWIRNA